MALDGPQDVDLFGSDAEAEEEIFSDINITPFTDVILVLLIIFMVSSSAMVDAAQKGRLEVSLPQAGHATQGPTPTEPLVIGMAADGRLFVRGRFVDAEQLGELLSQTHQQAPQTPVIVDADGTLPHRRVVQIIDRVRAAGFQVVGIGAEDGG
jgi:biopolymer transport protein ExbD